MCTHGCCQPRPILALCLLVCRINCPWSVGWFFRPFFQIIIILAHYYFIREKLAKCRSVSGMVTTAIQKQSTSWPIIRYWNAELSQKSAGIKIILFIINYLFILISSVIKIPSIQSKNRSWSGHSSSSLGKLLCNKMELKRWTVTYQMRWKNKAGLLRPMRSLLLSFGLFEYGASTIIQLCL